ncbi:MAG TPA: hypothetical protein VNQ76_12190 [Planctomicrobium sp.]|nr:hypothetical protein [Planctomicrobium sp.]
MEITPVKCRQAERSELKRLAGQIERRNDARGFLRRTWVMFSLAILGLGVWDFAFVQFHPLRTSVIGVGAILAFSLMMLTWIHERADQHQLKQAELLNKDAESGEYHKIRIPSVTKARRVRNAEAIVGYLIQTETETIYIGGPTVQDALDEYHHRQLQSGIESNMTMASEILLEQWPHSRKLRTFEFSGQMIPKLDGDLEWDRLSPHLQNGDEEEFFVIPPGPLALT